MLELYRRLRSGEKVLVWVAAAALIVLLVVSGNASEGVATAAQVVAGLGTLALAGLAYAQVKELRETRVAQERPQVIVDEDQSKPPLVYVVVRNIGKGAAKDISFEFSAPLESPASTDAHSPIVPVNEQPYFVRGIDFLAPGAEIPCLWDSMITLAPFLRERGLQDGITITSRYKSLAGEPHETKWTINPLLSAGVLYTREAGAKDIVKALDAISKDLHRVVSQSQRELRISTASERDERQNRNDEGGS